VLVLGIWFVFADDFVRRGVGVVVCELCLVWGGVWFKRWDVAFFDLLLWCGLHVGLVSFVLFGHG